MKTKQKTGTVINENSTSFSNLESKRARIFQLEQELDNKLRNKEMTYADYQKKQSELNNLWGILSEKYFNLKLRKRKEQELREAQQQESNTYTSVRKLNFAPVKLITIITALAVLIGLIGLLGISNNESFNALITNQIESGAPLIQGAAVAGSPEPELSSSSEEGGSISILAAPTQGKPILNSTYGTNDTTNEILTVYNTSTQDLDNDPVKNIINWKLDASTLTMLNMPFEATTGNNARDYSGNDNNATTVVATFNSTGGYDGFGAFKFDGIDDRVMVPKSASLNLNGISFTISFWFKCAGTNTTSTADRLMWNRNFGVDILVRQDNNGIDAYIYNDPGNPYVLLSAYDTDYCEQEWYHLVLINDLSGNKSQLYIDGDKKDEDEGNELLSDSADLYFGNTPGLANDFNGTIDDVIMFDEIVLTEDQIQLLYENRTDQIHPSMTSVGDVWEACMTPNDRTSDGTTNCSNNLTIVDFNYCDGTTTFNDLVVSNTETIDYDANCSTILVEDGATLYLDSTSTNSSVTINATNITIESGGLITGTGLGYPGAEGPRVGTCSGFQCGGGGHGDYGGQANEVLGVGGSFIGNSLEPVTLGSGGGDPAFYCTEGGAGGAAFKLNVLDTLNISGTLSSNGTDGAGCDVTGAKIGGGGSGGSIWIVTDTLKGDGSIQADGGAAGTESPYSGGGGSGGRIAIYYNALDDFNRSSASVDGGYSQFAEEGYPGSLVFIENDTDDMFIYQGFDFLEDLSTYDNITINQNSIIRFNDSLTLSTTNLNNLGYSNFTCRGEDYEITLNVDEQINLSNTLFKNLTNYYDCGNITFNINNKGSDTYQNLGIEVTDTIFMTNLSNSLNLSSSYLKGSIDLEVENLTITSDSYISGNELGHPKDSGPGNGANSGGAGYGGPGGEDSGGSGGDGISYGSMFTPDQKGSGGGSGAVGAYGGSGGAKIILNVTDTFTLDGNISSNGGNATPGGSTAVGGGGSGGGVWILTDILKGSGNIEVIGGDGGYNEVPPTYGGGGGGGRVALYYSSNSLSGDIFVTGGIGPGTAENGTNGTVFECHYNGNVSCSGESDDVLLLKSGDVESRTTYSSNTNIRLRKHAILNWSTESFLWNDSSSNHSCIATYNVTGLNASDVYTVKDNSVTTAASPLTTDSAGNLEIFDITLSSDHEVNGSKGDPPIIPSVIINSTFATNFTNENLTAYSNVSDPDEDQLKILYHWYIDDDPMLLFDMPFEGGSNDTWAEDYAFGNNISGYMGDPDRHFDYGFDNLGAFKFDGDDSLNVSYAEEIDAKSEMSIEFRVKPGTLLNFKMILCKSFASSGTQYGFRFDGSAMDVFHRPTDYSVFADDVGSFSVDTWYHIVGTFSKNLETYTIYSNGQVIDSGLITLDSRSVDQNALEIGRDTRNHSYFNGTIDDIRFWNRSLTAEQVLFLYQNKSNTTYFGETRQGERWQAKIIANDGVFDTISNLSNNLTIDDMSLANIILNSSNGTDLTSENLTINFDPVNGSSDAIVNWYLNGTSLMLLNMPFDVQDNPWKDYSPYSNNGTVTGAFWNSTGGYDGQGAYEFDGDDDYIEVSGFPFLESYTLEAWVKPESLTNVKYESFISRGGVWDASTNYAFGFLNSSGTYKLFLYYKDASTLGGIEYVLSSNPTGSWHHAVAVYDGSTRDLNLYLDGDLIVDDPNTVDPADGGQSLKIGSPDNVGTEFPFDGLISEVRIYNRTLSGEQVKALFQNRTDLIVANETTIGDVWNATLIPINDYEDGNPLWSNSLIIDDGINDRPVVENITFNSTSGTNRTTENLTLDFDAYDPNGDDIKNVTDWHVDGSSWAVLNMPFEGGSQNGNSTGVTDGAKDYTSYENNGTVYHVTWNSTAGYDGFGAYDFDGADEEITVADSSSLDLTTEATVTAWVKPNTLSLYNYVLSKGTCGDSDFAYSLQVESGKLKWNWDSAGDCVSTNSYVTNSTVVSANQWAHIAIVHNTSIVKLYVNGQEDTNTTLTGSYGSIFSGGGTLRIGNYISPGGLNRTYNGTLDDISVWNEALSASQIELLFQNNTKTISSEETKKNETWQAFITSNDRQLDSETNQSKNLTIDNTAPTIPVLIYLEDGGNTTNRTPTLVWNNSNDDDGDNLTYNFVLDDNSAFNLPEVNTSGINETNVTNTSYLVPTELNVDTVYYWKVRAYDGEDYSNFSTVFNFTVDSYIAISLIRDTIEFSEAEQGDSLNSSDGVHDPFWVENRGNVNINITVTATRFFVTESYPSDNYQFRIEENETGAFNVSASVTDWTNMTNVSAPTAVVDLDWHYFKNDFLTSLLIRIPVDEGSGVRSSTVTFEAD